MDLVKTLKFLKSLSRNNNRVWFEKNKGTYLECKESFEALVTAYLHELINFHPELASLNPKKLPFRIYRDVRFSKDKRPYKTNMGAGFSPNGKLVQEPGYYLHLEPGGSFLAGGIYMPDPTNLGKIRQEIDYNGDKLEKIMKDKSFRKWFKDFGDFDRLKTAPKGYAKDHPRIEWLKNRSFIVTHNFTDADVCNPRFVKNLSAASQAMKPLVDYMKEALA
ncbi:MAG TPA: DUF2461 domain-containing protein [Cyclobacteriaceae bacterium]|nr:DUF2461 domain-containing protein [Cytophagales bacterium]HNP75829.1 DUF2461 domain-containing protein [Cyclobacteriaceae bacterium]